MEGGKAESRRRKAGTGSVATISAIVSRGSDPRNQDRGMGTQLCLGPGFDAELCPQKDGDWLWRRVMSRVVVKICRAYKSRRHRTLIPRASEPEDKRGYCLNREKRGRWPAPKL
ncbi:MAG: hypothetical protein GX325_07805 [Peptococcaceae bacterium]|nr:hypothetical protein [Peptococcaceae bacterium]